MSAIDIVRKRILDQREEEALELLGGIRFGFEIDGEWYDPWQLTEEERLAWMQQVHDAMHDIREEGRLIDFTKAWAGLDKEHRDHLLDENSHLFAGSRIAQMKSLSDGDCAWLAGAESWQIADYLTDGFPHFPELFPDGYRTLVRAPRRRRLRRNPCRLPAAHARARLPSWPEFG